MAPGEATGSHLGAEDPHHRLGEVGEVEVLGDAELPIANARALVSGLRQAQDALRFDLREGVHCRTCSFYRSLCPAGRGNGILVEA